MSISFTKSGNFFKLVFSNTFSISCSSSSSGTPVIQMLVCLEMSQRLLVLSSFFFNSFFFLLFWLNAYFFLMFQIVDLLLALFPPQLVPCRFFFISLSVTFVSPWVFYVVAVLSEFLEHPDHQCFELCI